MATTLTKTSGPSVVGPGVKMATYEVLLDSSYPTGGEALDFTGEFSNISAILPAGNDTAADNTYKFSFIAPAYATAVTSSNVLIQAHWSPDGTSGEVFAEFTNTGDLSSVGACKIVVFGK